MKPPLKAISILAAVLAVLYVSSPWWIPALVSKQLPTGWQLNTMKVSWPGLTGINLKHVSVNGQLPGVGMTLEARNSRFAYTGLATSIDTAVLHIHLLAEADNSKQPLSIDDLSLPRLHPDVKLPALTVNQAQLAIHLGDFSFANNGGDKKAANKAEQPIVIALQGFQLDPADHGHYQLETRATLVGHTHINGHFKVAMSPAKLSAQIRFPADQEEQPWFILGFLQDNDAGMAPSELTLQFDAGASNGEWLNALLSNSSGGRLTQVSGQLQAQAIFSGAQARPLSQLSLHARQFQIDFDGSTGVIDATIEAKREAQRMRVEFVDTEDTAAGRILLVDRNSSIETVIANAVPQLKRTHDNPPEAIANAEIKFLPGSQLLLNLPASTQQKPSLNYSGGLTLGYSTGASDIDMSLSDLTLNFANVSQPDLSQTALSNTGQVDLAGNLLLNWKESAAFSYTNDTLSVAAKNMSLRAAGALAWSPGHFSFQSTREVDARLPGLRAKVQTGDPSAPGWTELIAEELQTSQAQLGFEWSGSAADSQLNYAFKGPLNAHMTEASMLSSAKPDKTTVTADKLNLNVTLVSDQTQLKTDGNGYLGQANVMPFNLSATRLDLKWADLNISDLTGTLDASTKGFKALVNEEPWTDFDLDASLELLKNDNIKGTGILNFGKAIALPVGFSGNTVSGKWDIDLPKHTVPLNNLRGVLRSAQIELPDDLKLTDGTISATGSIQVNDQISVKLKLSGTDIASVLAESNAQQASFEWDAGFLTDIFATGPMTVGHLQLAGGIDVYDLSLDLKLENRQTLGLSNISARLFDGQLNIDQLNYADTVIEDTMISLTHINLAKLLAYLDVDGLEGTGFIDFSLPAGSRGAAVHIIDGTFTSTGPGRLAYSKGNMAGVNIGLKALQNFQYKKLSGNIAYDSTGPYQVTIRMEGSNPDLYDGYPVIFNLTIHGSLPELFEAMFMTGNFEKSILEQIQMK